MVNLKNFIRLLALIVTVAVLVEGVVVNFLLAGWLLAIGGRMGAAAMGAAEGAAAIDAGIGALPCKKALTQVVLETIAK